MACQKILGVFLLISLCCFSVYANGEEAQTVEAEEVDAEDLKRAEYTKGSLCSYCDYCKVSNDAILNADVSQKELNQNL